ncbi:MAG: flagellar biosynthetic protein FliR [Pseudomonadota bacterium]
MQDFLGKIGVNINVTFHLIFLSLIWVRVLMMASVIPFLFGKPVPKYVVVGASIVLAIFVYPHIVPKTPPNLSQDLLALVVLYLKEIFYGLSIGMSVSFIFHAFAAVGQMIDNQRGMSIARLLIPQLGEQASMSGVFLFQLGVVLYLVLGGHLAFLDSCFGSFKTLPVLGLPIAGPGFFPLMDLFMRITGEVIYISLQMAAPVIIAIFLADIILGIANRVAPQINVWELGFHVKGYVGILLLFISLTIIGDQIHFYAVKSNRYADQVIELLQGKVPPGAPEAPMPEDGLPAPEDGAPSVQTVP